MGGMPEHRPCVCADPENCVEPVPGCRATNLDMHERKLDFGKHRGEPYTRAPIPYLRWMIDCNHSRAHFARSELTRRGLDFKDGDITISGHAIDSASLRVRKIWQETAKDTNEGLHAWLLRMCKEALDATDPDSEGRIIWYGMKLVFTQGELTTTLKTVMRDKTRSPICFDKNSPDYLKLPPEIECHADGNACHGCDYYYGKADMCRYAPDESSQDQK